MIWEDVDGIEGPWLKGLNRAIRDDAQTRMRILAAEVKRANEEAQAARIARQGEIVADMLGDIAASGDGAGK